MKHLKFIFLIVAFLLSSQFAAAVQKKKKRVFIVDFQDEFVKGHVKSPTIFHLFNKQQLDYDSLVDLKKDFLPEMRRTAGEID